MKLNDCVLDCGINEGWIPNEQRICIKNSNTKLCLPNMKMNINGICEPTPATNTNSFNYNEEMSFLQENQTTIIISVLTLSLVIIAILLITFYFKKLCCFKPINEIPNIITTNRMDTSSRKQIIPKIKNSELLGILELKECNISVDTTKVDHDNIDVNNIDNADTEKEIKQVDKIELDVKEHSLCSVLEIEKEAKDFYNNLKQKAINSLNNTIGTINNPISPNEDNDNKCNKENNTELQPSVKTEHQGDISQTDIEIENNKSELNAGVGPQGSKPLGNASNV